MFTKTIPGYLDGETFRATETLDAIPADATPLALVLKISNADFARAATPLHFLQGEKADVFLNPNKGKRGPVKGEKPKIIIG